MEQPEADRQRFLLLDTNVLVYSTNLLGNAMGAAVIYSLRRSGRALLLPEVVEEEVRKHVEKMGNESTSTIEQEYRKIEQLMGSRDDYRVPSADDFANRVETRFDELNDLIHRREITFEHAKNAFQRILAESPPNGYKNQQFKDSLIWECIIECVANSDVDFITMDKGFFDDKNPARGLAQNLKAELAALNAGSVRIFADIPQYLSTARVERVPLNEQQIARNIDTEIIAGLRQKAADKEYELQDFTGSCVRVFLTEKPDRTAVEFELTYPAIGVVDRETGEAVSAKLVVLGDCECNSETLAVSDVNFTRLRMDAENGIELPGYGTHVLRADSAYHGRRTIKHRIKELLDSP